MEDTTQEVLNGQRAILTELKLHKANLKGLGESRRLEEFEKSFSFSFGPRTHMEQFIFFGTNGLLCRGSIRHFRGALGLRYYVDALEANRLFLPATAADWYQAVTMYNFKGDAPARLRKDLSHHVLGFHLLAGIFFLVLTFLSIMPYLIEHVMLMTYDISIPLQTSTVPFWALSVIVFILSLSVAFVARRTVRDFHRDTEVTGLVSIPAFKILGLMKKYLNLLQKSKIILAVYICILVLVTNGHLCSGFKRGAANLENLNSRASTCYPAIFVFGDALMDNGNLLALNAHSYNQSMMEAYMVNVEPNEHQYRMSDFLALGLGLPYPSPYFETIRPNFESGVSFAYSGATAGTGINVIYNLEMEIYWFNQFRHNILNAGDAVNKQPLPKEEDFKEGLYIFEIGGNDYLVTFTLLNTSTYNLTTLIVPYVIQQIQSNIEAIIGNITNLMFINIPPIGCSEFVKESTRRRPDNQLDGDGCVLSLNTAVEAHNQQLRQMINHLQSQYPNVNFIHADYYSFVRTAMSSTSPTPTPSSEEAEDTCSYNLAGCYANSQITSTTMFRNAARDFLNGNYLEPSTAFNQCQLN